MSFWTASNVVHDGTVVESNLYGKWHRKRFQPKGIEQTEKLHFYWKQKQKATTQSDIKVKKKEKEKRQILLIYV